MLASHVLDRRYLAARSVLSSPAMVELVMAELVGIVVVIATLSVLLAIRECGHYLVARWCRIRIKRVSLGFGPAIFERTSQKTGTSFRLALIPFGVFVKIGGMNLAGEIDPDDEYAYPNRPAWQRFVTIIGGPAANYLSAIVVAMLLYTCHGIDVPRWYGVSAVMAGYDAHGKLAPGDRILEVDHVPLFLDSGPSLIERVNAAKGAAITLTIERNGQPREVSIAPRLDQDSYNEPIWRIGVRPVPQYQVVDIGLFEAAGRALTYSVEATKMIVVGLYGVVFGDEQADPGGPIRVAEELRRAFSASLVQGIWLLMMLSVYFGLLSLLPIPFFDGGRLVVLVYRTAIRSRARPTS